MRPTTSSILRIAEATKAGILPKPAAVLPTEVYTEKRIAEFEAKNNRELTGYFPDPMIGVYEYVCEKGQQKRRRRI